MTRHILRSLACAVVVTAGCDALLGIEDTTVDPSAARVSGAAVGVVEPVSLRLEYSGGSEVLNITADGPFEFTSELTAGTSYTVVLVGQPACALGGENGAAGPAAPAVELACEGAVYLSALAMSSVDAPDLAFTPERTSYEVALPLIQATTRITATAARDGVAIDIDGEAADSGAPSAPVALRLGANAIDVRVTHPLGLERTYTIEASRDPGLAQFAYAKASNTDPGDNFGFALVIEGDTMAVGAPLERSGSPGVDADQTDNSGLDAGAVYVFRRTGTVWEQEAYLKASNAGATIDDQDQFGVSLALQGNTLVVGAALESSGARGVDGDQGNNDEFGAGAVYVFERSGGEWSQQAYIKASNTDSGDLFGDSVDLDGDTLVVGAPFEASAARGVDVAQDDNSAPDAGAVYVFRRVGDEWTQEAYIKASNTDPSDEFGSIVDIDGDVLAVSALREDSADTGTGADESDNNASAAGAVYVFRRSGGKWAQEAYLKPSNTGVGDTFGDTLSLSGDLLAVGAPFEDSSGNGVDGNQNSNAAENAGAVYVFRRDGVVWVQEVYIKASVSETGDLFGKSVALAGELLAVGASGEGSASTGIDGVETDNSAVGSGATYLYYRTPKGWVKQNYLKASNTSGEDQFGSVVALSDGALAVCALGEDSRATGVDGDQSDDGASGAGAVYVFH